MRGPMPGPGQLRAVLFDWDGTLVDSAAKTYRCYVRVFSAHGIPFDRIDFERTYSPDWYRTYELVGLPRERWEAADACWLECYGTEPSHLLPGAALALERLAQRGISLGLVTSGDGLRVRRELQELAVERLFGAVVCGGETERRKPDPEPLRVALERLGVDATRAAYLGDSPEDVAMAKSAGAYAVGIPGGFPNRLALAASEPDALAPSLEAALEVLLG
jgi:HAD superfamily hydrolase (TIGR01509 family)